MERTEWGGEVSGISRWSAEFPDGQQQMQKSDSPSRQLLFLFI